jgi:hypothetical protein
MTRQNKLHWMKDLLEHMDRCHEQWETADERMESFLAESLRRDIDEFRRICDSLRSSTPDEMRQLAVTSA